MPLQIRCPCTQPLSCPLADCTELLEKNYQTCGKSSLSIMTALHGHWFLSTQNMVNKLSVTLKTPESFLSTHPEDVTPKEWLSLMGNFPCSLRIEHVSTKTDICWFCPPSIHLPLSGNSSPVFLWETTSSLLGGSFRDGHMTQAWPIKAFLLTTMIDSETSIWCKPRQLNSILGLLLKLLQMGYLLCS